MYRQMTFEHMEYQQQATCTHIDEALSVNGTLSIRRTGECIYVRVNSSQSLSNQISISGCIEIGQTRRFSRRPQMGTETQVRRSEKPR